MVAFYKHHISDWRGGTVALSDRAYRVYHVIVEQIMLHEGPIAAHERTLAGLSNRSVRDLRAALDELVAAGKITIGDGRITQHRAVSELTGVRNNRENAATGGRTPRQQAANGGRVRREQPATTERIPHEKTENANDIKGEIGASLQRDGSLIEKTREEKTTEPIGSGARERAERAKRLPDDWQPSELDVAYAGREGLSPNEAQREAEKFRDHWRAASGETARKHDWAAAWRNWVRRAVENRGRGPPVRERKVIPI